MDAHNHTLDKFSIYRLSDDALNVKYDTGLGHAYARLERPYQFWHAVLPDLLHIHHCALFQNVPGFLPHWRHGMASFCQAQQNYRGLSGFLQAFADLHTHHPVQLTEWPRYKAAQNSSMHSEARPLTGNPAILRHWQSRLHIPALLHPGWCHQNADYIHH